MAQAELSRLGNFIPRPLVTQANRAGRAVSLRELSDPQRFLIKRRNLLNYKILEMNYHLK